jgi:hypothetical protein
MACPTCDHTMHKLSLPAAVTSTWWCPRCGTLKHELVGPFEDREEVPALVKRCREFEKDRIVYTFTEKGKWITLGITDAIHLPEERIKP